MEQIFYKRINRANQNKVNTKGLFVIYWMIANRRGFYNIALQRAVWWAEILKKPIIILEGLRVDYKWASERFHSFIIDGMIENSRFFGERNVFYYPYIEPGIGLGKGLLKSLSEYASVIVTDEFPCFFFPNMLQKAARSSGVLLEVVDSNGLLPMRAPDGIFQSARGLRGFLEKELASYLATMPEKDPLERIAGREAQIPEHILKGWPPADLASLEADDNALRKYPVDHGVRRVATKGGHRNAIRLFEAFLDVGLFDYRRARMEYPSPRTSRMSPFLHFGHVAVHELFLMVLERAGLKTRELYFRKGTFRGKWWGLPEDIAAFLDQLITWRELGFNMCFFNKDYDKYQSLPPWARGTLERHRGESRSYTYSLEGFEQAITHDSVWNLAQQELLRDGTIHNYLRMLWGKKILEWSESPQSALDIMIHLNNKYALDGRDPNSYSNIFWILGRYDRPFGPERPILGKIRYMSSDSAKRKLKISNRNN